MAKRSRAVRRITVPVQEKLNRLVANLYPFLPLSSRSSNAVTFSSVFAESGVADYLEGPRNKTQALQKGFTELYRRHRRLPYTVIRKVVPAAIDYRAYQRNPLRREEVDALSDCLYELAIDMRQELGDLSWDETLPRIRVPPTKLQEALRQHDLEPELQGEPLRLFEDGHFNEAVRKTAERFENLVHELSGLESFGRDLMARAFESGILLETERLEPENEKGFVEGYKFLAMGVTGAIRNVFSHGDEEKRSPEECFEMLLLLNWMLRGIKRNGGTCPT